MYTRPKYNAKKDANHAEILRDLAKMCGQWTRLSDSDGSNLPAYTGYVLGVPFLLLDTSQAGGLTLDTRVYVGDIARDVEIKQPATRGDLTPCEALYFRLTPKTGRVVTCAEEYYALICDMVEAASR